MLNLFGEPMCTPGHEASCKRAACGDCHCDCGGKNHGILIKNKAKKFEKKPKKKTIKCPHCGGEIKIERVIHSAGFDMRTARR